MKPDAVPTEALRARAGVALSTLLFLGCLGSCGACEREGEPRSERNRSAAFEAARDAAVATDAPAATYTCSMHPSFERDEPGSCPICGMDLVPVSSQPPTETPLPKVQVRCDAGACRANRGDVRRLLEAAAESSDPSIHSAAVTTLPPPELREALTESAWMVRTAAAYELGRRGDRDSLRPLREASEDSRNDGQGLARLTAIEARLRLGDQSAADELASWLTHDDFSPRVTALEIASSYPALHGRARRAARNAPAALGREQVQAIRARSGDEEARAAITDRWDRTTYSLHAKLHPDRARARLERLAAATEPPPAFPSPVRRAAWYWDRVALAEALFEVGSPKGAALLNQLLEFAERGDDEEVPLVLETCRRHAGAVDRRLLARWLDHRSEVVRAKAAAAWWAADGAADQ